MAAWVCAGNGSQPDTASPGCARQENSHDAVMWHVIRTGLFLQYFVLGMGPLFAS
jgi:hypothetical protein